MNPPDHSSSLEQNSMLGSRRSAGLCAPMQLGEKNGPSRCGGRIP